MSEKLEQRAQEIAREHEAQIAAIGRASADRELYHAFAREEASHDALKAKILGLVTVIDRRGIFLPPALNRVSDEVPQ
jgi:hypothetical protein